MLAWQLIRDKQMSAQSECSGGKENIVSVACSGQSNVGQLTNDAAKELGRLDQVRFLSLAAIGAADDEAICAIQNAEQVIVFDGCDKACARKIMESSALRNFTHIDVESLGIEKRDAADYTQEEIEGVMAQAVLLCQGHRNER